MTDIPDDELKRRAAIVRRAMESLNERDRRLIVLRDWDKLEYAEIGESLGVYPEAARSAHRRARERLREEMKRFDDGPDDGMAAVPLA